MLHQRAQFHFLRASIKAMFALGVAAISINAAAQTAAPLDPSTCPPLQKHTATMAGMAGMTMADHAQHMQALKEMQGQPYQRSVTAYPLPKMELVDKHGTAVSVDDLLNTDQPLIVNFIFTSCTTICPIMSATFSQAQKRMGDAAKDVKWVSISIDPEYDTPARLREYAERYHAGDNWRFITGDIDRIITLEKAFKVYHGSKMNHKPVTLMRAGRDQPWVRLEGLTSGAELVAEYRQIAPH